MLCWYFHLLNSMECMHVCMYACMQDFRQNIVFSFGAGLLAAVVTAMVISGSSEPKTVHLAQHIPCTVQAEVPDVDVDVVVYFCSLPMPCVSGWRPMSMIYASS